MHGTPTSAINMSVRIPQFSQRSLGATREFGPTSRVSADHWALIMCQRPSTMASHCYDMNSIWAIRLTTKTASVGIWKKKSVHQRERLICSNAPAARCLDRIRISTMPIQVFWRRWKDCHPIKKITALHCCSKAYVWCRPKREKDTIKSFLLCVCVCAFTDDRQPIVSSKTAAIQSGSGANTGNRADVPVAGDDVATVLGRRRRTFESDNHRSN